MSEKIHWREVLDLFEQISAGRVTVEPVGNDGCQLFWRTSNGWRIEVFDDCGQWDYIDDILSPDGRELTFEDISSARLDDRIPTEEELHSIWWHPGWLCKYPTEKPKDEPAVSP